MLGIALDGWDRVGWHSSFADRFMLFRDRKTIVAPLLVGAGYAAFAMVSIDAFIPMVLPAARSFPPIVGRDSLLAVLLVINMGSLGWRLGLRASFTAANYGWREGLRAIPRTIVANVINAASAGARCAATSASAPAPNFRAGTKPPIDFRTKSARRGDDFQPSGTGDARRRGLADAGNDFQGSGHLPPFCARGGDDREAASAVEHGSARSNHGSDAAVARNCGDLALDARSFPRRANLAPKPAKTAPGGGGDRTDGT